MLYAYASRPRTPTNSCREKTRSHRGALAAGIHSAKSLMPQRGCKPDSCRSVLTSLTHTKSPTYMRESVAACIDSEAPAALYLFLLLEFENSDLLKIRIQC